MRPGGDQGHATRKRTVCATRTRQVKGVTYEISVSAADSPASGVGAGTDVTPANGGLCVFVLRTPPLPMISEMTHASPLEVPALRARLAALKASGAVGSWGASVHSVRGGQIALAAGADMIQVSFSCLQQENAALLAQCGVLRKGVLVQSALCQGWLTDVGVAAARLLIAAGPRRVPRYAPTAYPSIDFHTMLRAILRLDSIAARLRCTISALALRYVVHAPGCTSALVQARTAAQLRQIMDSLGDLAPLPADVVAEIARIGGGTAADGRLVHGGSRLWHWGAPPPRWCIDALVRSRAVPLPRLLEVAAVGDAELRARFVRDGFVKLESAFPQALAARLVRPDGRGAARRRRQPARRRRRARRRAACAPARRAREELLPLQLWAAEARAALPRRGEAAAAAATRRAGNEQNRPLSETSFLSSSKPLLAASLHSTPLHSLHHRLFSSLQQACLVTMRLPNNHPPAAAAATAASSKWLVL